MQTILCTFSDKCLMAHPALMADVMLTTMLAPLVILFVISLVQFVRAWRAK